MLRQAEDCLWNSFVTKEMELERFKNEAITTLADVVTESMGASRYKCLIPDVIKLGRKYQCMTNSEPNLLTVVPPYDEVPKSELYLECNKKKTFISMDLRRADYTLLLLACPDWVGHQPTWESFVETVMKQELKRGEVRIGGTEKLRAIRTRILGKLCHTKNVVLQSHVLRMIVRAILFNIEEDHLEDFKVKRIFRFSCDELIFECEGEDPRPTLSMIQGIMEKALPNMVQYVRLETFKLHMLSVTDSMKRAAESAEMISSIEKEMDPREKCQSVFEGEIEELWTNQFETKVEEKSSDVFFVREDLITRKLAIKALPRACLTEAVPFVAHLFHKIPPIEQIKTASNAMKSVSRAVLFTRKGSQSEEQQPPTSPTEGDDKQGALDSNVTPGGDENDSDQGQQEEQDRKRNSGRSKPRRSGNGRNRAANQKTSSSTTSTESGKPKSPKKSPKKTKRRHDTSG